MEAIHVIIAENSVLTRMGIIGMLQQTDFPLLFREINLAEKLGPSLQKNQKNLLIISQSFINQGTPELIGNISLKQSNTLCMLIQDTEPLRKSILRPDDTISREDQEKVISRKFEKLLRVLSEPKSALNQVEEISDREKEVLQLVALGMTNKEIADKLFISSHTVITHRKNITSKLGIKTIAGLTVYAIIHKLIDPESVQRPGS
jgi:DNA-binding CsgD family transcriptional regulator